MTYEGSPSVPETNPLLWVRRSSPSKRCCPRLFPNSLVFWKAHRPVVQWRFFAVLRRPISGGLSERRGHRGTSVVRSRWGARQGRWTASLRHREEAVLTISLALGVRATPSGSVFPGFFLYPFVSTCICFSPFSTSNICRFYCAFERCRFLASL